eukprot:4531242-Alexandrium_andersonii.AAC.1
MASFVINHSPEVVDRAKRISKASYEWEKMREKFDFSWAVRLGHRGPEEGRLKPGSNDDRSHWELFSEAF